jgi:dTDP-4-dehydrorhamnose 3,5-epimerase
MPSETGIIDGVLVKPLRVIPDERGRLMEILRSDDQIFVRFGQVYITTAYPGVVKGWHYHKRQTDNMTVVYGMMKIALYDARDESPTKGMVNEFFVGLQNPMLIQIPPLVFHGFKCIGDREAIVINVPTEVYSYSEPDEYRVHPHDNDIPYSWGREDG